MINDSSTNNELTELQKTLLMDVDQKKVKDYIPDLYSYWDNKEEWTNKFITYSARTKEWDLIVDEPFDSCFTFPLFTEEFCKKLEKRQNTQMHGLLIDMKIIQQQICY